MNSPYATGGTIPSYEPSADGIPAVISECGYLIEPLTDDDPAAAA